MLEDEGKKGISQIIMSLLWPILQSRLFRFSARLKFQDGPRVAIVIS